MKIFLFCIFSYIIISLYFCITKLYAHIPYVTINQLCNVCNFTALHKANVTSCYTAIYVTENYFYFAIFHLNCFPGYIMESIKKFTITAPKQ